MKTLYLVRHAVAHPRDVNRWPDDGERPLTPEGERDFRFTAGQLGRMFGRVDVLLSSPFARAWRTAEILDEETGWPAPISFPALEPDVPPDKVAAALETYSNREYIVLVGHRPGLHELASYLLTGEANRLNLGLKKGGVACLRFDGLPGAGLAKLRLLLTPKSLHSLAQSPDLGSG